MSADAECLRSYSESSDQRGFTDFVQRNVNLVYSAAYRQSHGDAQLAEEITQEVFVAAARKAGPLSRHPVIAAWLFQTTRFAAVDALRAKRRRQEKEAAVTPEENAAPQDLPEWDHVAPRLDELIASLGEGDRQAVVLRFLSDQSFAEIGAQLGISENGARMRVERALEKLRAKLARRGVTSTTAALGALIAQQAVMAAPAGLGASAAAAAMAAPALGLGASVLTALRLMSLAKITAGVATLVAVLGITAAFHEHQVARAAQQAEAAAQAEADAARARAKRSDAAALSTAKELASLRSAAHGAHAGDAPGQDGAGSAPKSGLAAVLALFQNPEFESVKALEVKARLDAQYGALFHSLGLSPDDLEKFKHLLVEEQMAGFESMAAAKDQGIDLNSDPRGLVTAMAISVKTVDAQISSLLGSSGYQQFQAYQETVPARNTSAMLQQALSYTAAPLTPEQSASLVQVLAQYGKPAMPVSSPFSVLNGDLGVVTLSPAGLAQAQSFLSGPQVAALQQKVQEQGQVFAARAKMGH